MYHQFNIQQFYAMYLCVLCGYENKQLLFPYAALTYMGSVYCAVRTGLLNTEDYVSCLKA